jgi:hypothetical protein
MKSKWVCCVFVVLMMVACGEKNKSEAPSAPKVVVEKGRSEKPFTPPPPEVKVKLRRDGKENYSWELSGSDVDQILKADEKLKKQLGGEQHR